MLPQNLKYGSKVESSFSRPVRTNIAPQNGTGPYNLGDTIIVNIPTRQNLVQVPTDSYLKFTCQVNTAADGNAYRFDSAGAHGLIQRINVFHGSNLLESIDNYAQLSKILFDFQVPGDSSYGKYNVCSGTRGDQTIAFTTAATYAANGNYSYSVNQTNSGERLFANGAIRALEVAANNSTAAVQQSFCLNLISLMGSLCSTQYIPLFAMTSAPLRIEIKLQDYAFNCFAAIQAVSSVQLSNVEYIASFLELGDGAMSMINESLGGNPLQLCIPSYRNYQYVGTLTQNVATQVAFPIPAKFSSLKNLLVASRQSASIGAATYFPYSGVTQGLTDYTFRIGPNVFPSKSPTTYPEMFLEAIKCFSTISDLNHQPSIEKTSYTMATSIANNDTATNIGNVNSGSFLVGIDVESYSGSNKSSIFAGYNSNTDDIFYIGNYFNTTTNTATRFDAWACFDLVLVCESGTCYAKF